MRYSQNPSLHYLQVSDDEVIVKGSHLEGFSLLVSDETQRGFTGKLIDFLASAAPAEDAHAAVAPDGLSLEDFAQFLDELADAGAIVRHGERDAAVTDWISFLRYGHLDPSVQRHQLVCVGGVLAERVAHAMADLGFSAQHRPTVTSGDLELFVVPDSSMNVTARMAENGDQRVNEEDVPDDDVPRLAFFVEGAPLSMLYRLNEAAMEAGVPILYGQVAGSDYAVGPHVVPGSTACFWEFEKQRSRSMFSFSEYAVLVAAGGQATTPAVSSAAFVAAVVPHLVELALLGRSMLAGQVLRGRATTGETSKHSVMRLPRCPVCLAHRPLLRNLLY